MNEFDQLLAEAEVREQPETAALPQEDEKRKVPKHVDIAEHRREGDDDHVA